MRQILAIFILLDAAALVAARSRASGPDIPNASGSASAGAGSGDLTAFVNYVRQHGVTVPDHVTLQAAWQRAEQEHAPGWEACKALLPERPANQLFSAQELERLRSFAVCMRAHGIDMSDPQQDGDMPIGGRLAHASRAQELDDPVLKAAQAAWRDKLAGGRNPWSATAGKKPR